jgi:hypothetical protein
VQVQQLDTADETKVPMPRGGFAFAEVERSGGGDGEIRRTTSRLSTKAHPGRVQKMEGSPRWGRSVCQSRVVVLLLLEAVAVREGFGLATTTTIGKYGRVVRNGLLARACVLACCALCHQSRIVLPPNNITLPCKIPRQTPGGTRLGSSKQACVCVDLLAGVVYYWLSTSESSLFFLSLSPRMQPRQDYADSQM